MPIDLASADRTIGEKERAVRNRVLVPPEGANRNYCRFRRTLDTAIASLR